MKIGTFAKLYNVSADTVRYYIELGLLIPEKKTQYQMNQSCLEDMSFITELKRFHFSLQEIHQILSYKRITNFSDNDDMNYYTNVLSEKKIKLIEEKNQISRAIHLIEETIHSSSEANVNDSFTGIPLSFAPLLYCPQCRVPLKIEDVIIHERYILSGNLYCVCGYKVLIKDGILITDNLYETSPYPSYFYDKETIKEITPHMISLFEKSNLWMQKELRDIDLKKKLVIETNVDVYVFLPKYLDSLEASAYYVFSGYSIDMLKKLKKRIERNNSELTVLYIANNDLTLPLKPQSVDVIIDSFSSNDFSVLNNKFPISVMKPYLHSDSKIIGSYSYYNHNAKSLKNVPKLYPDSHNHVFYPNYIEESLSSLQFQLIKKEYIGYTEDPGIFFDYHVTNEKFHMLAYIATYGNEMQS